MPLTNVIKGYFNLVPELIKEENSKVQARTSNANQIQIVTPFDSTLNASITFLLNNGRSVDWQSLIPQGTEEVEVSTGIFETWNVYTYDVASNVLSTVSLKTSSPLYYQARFREEDEDFSGLFTTEYGVLNDNDFVEIDEELKAEYGVLADGKFITVTNITEGANTTYQSNGSYYEYLGYEKSQYILSTKTPMVELAIYPSINSTETSLSASEVDIIRSWIEDLEDDIVSFQGS